MNIFHYLMATTAGWQWIKLSLVSNTEIPNYSIRIFDATGKECNESELTFPVLVYDFEKKTYGCLYVLDAHHVVLYPVVTSFEEPRIEKGTIYSTTENKWVTALENNVPQYHPKKIFQNFPLNNAYAALQKILVEQTADIQAGLSQLVLLEQKEQLAFEMMSLSKQWMILLARDFSLFWEQIEGVSTAQEFGASILVLLEKGVPAQAIIDSGFPGSFYLMNVSNSDDIEIAYQALEIIKREGEIEKREALSTFLLLCNSYMLGYPGISQTLNGGSLPKPFLAHNSVFRLPRNAGKPTFIERNSIGVQEKGHFVVAYWSINNVVQSRTLPKSYLGERIEELTPGTEAFILELTSRYCCNLAMASAEITSEKIATLFSYLINHHVQDIPLDINNWKKFVLIANTALLLSQKREQLHAALTEFYLDLVVSRTESNAFCNEVKATIDTDILNHWVQSKIVEQGNNIHKLYSTFAGELTRDVWIDIRDIYQKERLKTDTLHELFGLDKVLTPLALDELQAKLLKQCLPKWTWSKSQDAIEVLSSALDIFLFETDNGNYTVEEKIRPRIKLLNLLAIELAADIDNVFFDESTTPRVSQLTILNENNKATRLKNRLYINGLFGKIIPSVLLKAFKEDSKIVSVVMEQFLNERFKEVHYPLVFTLMTLLDSNIDAHAQSIECILLQWSDFILDKNKKELDITKIIALCDEVAFCKFIFYWLENSSAFNKLFWRSLVQVSDNELKDLFDVIILDSDARQRLLKTSKSQADFWDFLIKEEPSQFANFFSILKAWTDLQEYADWKPLISNRKVLIRLCQKPDLLPLIVGIFNQTDARGNTFWDYLAIESSVSDFAAVYDILMRASETEEREAISNSIRMQNSARPCAFDIVLGKASLSNLALMISTVVKPSDLPQMRPVLENFLRTQGKAFWQAMMHDAALFNNDSFMAIVEYLYHDPEHHSLLVQCFSKYYKGGSIWGKESVPVYARIMDLLFCAKTDHNFSCNRYGIQSQRRIELIHFLNLISENENYQTALMTLFDMKDSCGNNGWGNYYGYPVLDADNISHIIKSWVKINDLNGSAQRILLPASVYSQSINHSNFTINLEQGLRQALKIGNLSWIAVLLEMAEVNEKNLFAPMFQQLKNEGNTIQVKCLLKAYVCFKLSHSKPSSKSFYNLFAHLPYVISPEEVAAVYNELLSEVGDKMLAHCIRLAFNAPSNFVIAVRAELKRRYVANDAFLSPHIQEALQEPIEYVNKAELLICIYQGVIAHECAQWRKNPELYHDKLKYIADCIFFELFDKNELAAMVQAISSRLLQTHSKLAEHRTTFFINRKSKSQQLVSLAHKKLGQPDNMLSVITSFIDKRFMGGEICNTLPEVILGERLTTSALAAIPLTQEEINKEVWRRVLIHGCFNATLKSVYEPPYNKNKGNTYRCIVKYVRNREGDQPYDEECLARDLEKIGPNEKPSIMGLFNLGTKECIKEDLKQLSVVLKK